MNNYRLITILTFILSANNIFSAAQKKNVLFDFKNIPSGSFIEIKPAKGNTLTANPGYQRIFELERDTNILGKNPQYIKDIWITPLGKNTIKASGTKDLVESTNRFIEQLDNPAFVVKESGIGLSIGLSSATPPPSSTPVSKPVEPAKPISSGSKPSDARWNVAFDFTKVASNPKVEFITTIKVYNPVNPTPINISTVGSYGVNQFGLNDIKKHTFGNPEYVKEIEVGTQFKSGNISMGKSFKASSVKGLIDTINKLIYQTPQNLTLAFELDTKDQLKLSSDKETSSGTTKPSVPAAQPIGGPKSTPAITTKKFSFKNMYGEPIALDVIFSDGKREVKTLPNTSSNEYVLSTGKTIKSVIIKPNSRSGALDIDKFYDQDAGTLIQSINEEVQSGETPTFIIEADDFSFEYL
jgi:LEA14-like dessication related protein